MIKLSDYVFKFLAEQSVKHVFTLVGGGCMHLVDSLGRNKDIEYICPLHEQAVAIACEAYAQYKNDLGVALVTTGPGSTNTITGVAGAWLESTPCLFLSGQVKTSDMIGSKGIRQMGFQEIEIVKMVTQITKYAVTVMDPSEIRYHLEKAIHLAKNGRPGPVWLDIPLDVQAAMIDENNLQQFKEEEVAQSREYNLRDQIVKTIDLLSKSKKPIILVGNGVTDLKYDSNALWAMGFWHNIIDKDLEDNLVAHHCFPKELSVYIAPTKEPSPACSVFY